MEDSTLRLEQLQAKLADLRARMPAHTPRPSMLLEMEDLEEEIESLRNQNRKDGEGHEQGDR